MAANNWMGGDVAPSVTVIQLPYQAAGCDRRLSGTIRAARHCVQFLRPRPPPPALPAPRRPIKPVCQEALCLRVPVIY